MLAPQPKGREKKNSIAGEQHAEKIVHFLHIIDGTHNTEYRYSSMLLYAHAASIFAAATAAAAGAGAVAAAASTNIFTHFFWLIIP